VRDDQKSYKTMDKGMNDFQKFERCVRRLDKTTNPNKTCIAWQTHGRMDWDDDDRIHCSNIHEKFESLKDQSRFNVWFSSDYAPGDWNKTGMFVDGTCKLVVKNRK
jgi:hypothetical protein